MATPFRVPPSEFHVPISLALLEIGNLSPAFVVADRCAKAAGVRIIGIESTDSTAQCIKLAGSTDDAREAAETGAELGRRMGTTAFWTWLPAPREETLRLATQPPVYSPLLGVYDARAPLEKSMNPSDAIGLLETQGLVAALHATDEMLKSAAVSLVGKEKIGAAYVTIMVRGDVAAVQAAISAGKQTVERLGGKLIMADVIPRPHPELAALLPG
ncbi:MAG TPA: BMC domain-containing protein [Pirellulales bacterium]|nr:BMC domain-containing protein [Pirellulales bacterium]